MPEPLIDRVSRPVLVGGLGLSAGLALWNSLSLWGTEAGGGDGFSAIGLCALGWEPGYGGGGESVCP
ncbi:MAG: hypothetical protein HC795_11330 [Coleofasciculaceae cyanobacterium RL_1_1]|nr:hypothetical protein [Coleofasciculaceae cyanobacterium RL_1_1]